MRSALRAVIVAVAGCLVAACGSTSILPAVPGGFRGDIASGKLVQVSGSTLTLSTENGDVSVTFSNSTTIEKTASGSDADITVGSCLSATGAQEGGTLTATTVTVSPSTDGSCGLGGRFGGGVNPGGPNISASFSPRPVPSGFAPGLSFVRGRVTAVDGTSVSVQSTAGSTESVTVPTTATVSVTSPGTSADLVDGVCVSATGSRSSSGAVAAQSLDVEAAGPSGCPSARGGGFGGGGFGGGGAGSGGGSGITGL